MAVITDLHAWRKAASKYRGKVQSNLTRTVRRVRHVLDWNYLRNPASSRRFTAQPRVLTPGQQAAVGDLASRGIAFVQQDRLGIDPTDWTALRSLVRGFAASEQVRERIRDFPALAESRPLVGDDYMVKLYPESPMLEASNPLLRVGLSAAMLNVVNGYLGLWSKLVYTDAWHTIPVDIGRRVGSQSWHRDPEDRKMIKAYLYCADVDAGAGPMEYIPGSALGGRYAHLWPWKPRGTHAERYPSEEEVARHVPPSEWVLCTGSEGTVVFCDTDGLHRGGISRTSARLLATWTFVTPAAMGSTVQRRFRIAPGSSAAPPSPEAAFALA